MSSFHLGMYIGLFFGVYLAAAAALVLVAHRAQYPPPPFDVIPGIIAGLMLAMVLSAPLLFRLMR